MGFQNGISFIKNKKHLGDFLKFVDIFHTRPEPSQQKERWKNLSPANSNQQQLKERFISNLDLSLLNYDYSRTRKKF